MEVLVEDVWISYLFGAAPAKGRVGPLRSSQVCSALQRLRRLGLPPSAALLQPLSLRPSGPAKPQNRTKKAR
ncbi:hypothetical protein SGRA_1502 [Saprospira grandis str. Lewin]|uniref:Uncharacterized protein n=1 Tax=Saprospira grandis (strain Lewin) TaxID=984262 RepID=H6L965_SAPGL|nr:hypothetical protein SGRA_1502 [Saprospira grandis str. Lewin]